MGHQSYILYFNTEEEKKKIIDTLNKHNELNKDPIAWKNFEIGEVIECCCVVKINKSSILNKYLNKLINIRLEDNKDYLLENTEDNRLTPNGLTKLLQKIFKTYFDKKISSSDLRHIYISNLSPDLTNKKLSKIAEDMRHSIETQQKIYKKV